MKIIFFGSSDFSIPALKACRDFGAAVVWVLTTPDQKKGRGLQLLPNPVKVYAAEHRLLCQAPESLKNPALIEEILSMKPEVFVVSSYGKFIPSAWLKLPSQAALNVHPSLLPKYRGAAPINWPILNGDQETGVSIIEVADKLDAGDLFYQETFPIPEDMDAGTLAQELARRSHGALLKVLGEAEKGNLKRTPQEEALSSYARKLTKEDGRILWTQEAPRIVNLVRGLIPWPTAYTLDPRRQPLQILKARVADLSKKGEPGEISALDKSQGVEVQTGRGSIWVERVKPAGKKEMSALDFARGHPIQAGLRFQT